MANILRISNSQAPSKGKRNLLTSYNVNDVIKRAPRYDNGNVTLMAQESKRDFILHFATQLILQSCFPVNNEVQTMFTPILIPDKNIRELRNNVNQTSKKFNSSRFFGLFMFQHKTIVKWKKNNPS